MTDLTEYKVVYTCSPISEIAKEKWVHSTSKVGAAQKFLEEMWSKGVVIGVEDIHRIDDYGPVDKV